ncbi:Phosphatidylcholine:diacylglycerol cholinephosphotransferase [Zostera marina]|uniref:Phosphatidylcholine:diacylglycerol cholinephosphotransferase n=1 Tax=Zostera marina TaxID=29655 RepID=A0A0K9PBS3_ZOSMR|nr:Phosphatidylcholine:diacylglycerol cholinephosphotransferase [Zostera marina]
MVGLKINDIVGLMKYHPIPVVFAATFLLFIVVEHNIVMVPAYSPPFDVGFLLTRPMNTFLASKPALNNTLAALNTVFVGTHILYVIWALVVHQRPRPAISALFMSTCRGILGYSTQLPLPKDFLGSGMDFPLGNLPFFLFFSGHVAGALIVSLDMRRLGRNQMAFLFDTLNLLQALRLLITRGHYTIDLAVGVGAGIFFDSLAGKYEKKMKKKR